MTIGSITDYTIEARTYVSPKTGRKYGWKRGPQHIGRPMFAPRLVKKTFPPEADVLKWTPPVRNQGQIGDCTGFGCSEVTETALKKETGKDIYLSKFFPYYGGRAIESVDITDSGAMIDDVLTFMVSYGDCPDEEWPEVDRKVNVKPYAKAYNDAAKYRIQPPLAIDQTLPALMNCIVSGFPFVFGITIYDSFESDDALKTGHIPMPSPDENILGGHCVICVGYSKGQWTCQNSWGTDVQDKGFFYLLDEFILNRDLATNFRVVQKVNHP